MLPVFWISGNYYDSQKYWHRIVSTLGKEVNVEVLFCGYASQDRTSFNSAASDVIKLLKNRDLFDDRPRIIKLKGIPDDYTLITDYLKLCNNDNVLVIEGPVGYKAKPPRKRFISAASSKFYKTIKSKGKLLVSETEVKTYRQAEEWIVNVVKEHKKNLEPEAATLLMEFKGKNLDVLYGELTKLFAYVPGKNITADQVKECCVPLYMSDVWEMLDNLDYADYDKAMLHLQKFYRFAGVATGTTFYGDVMKLFGALHQHYLFLLLLKDNCGKQITADKAKEAVSGLFKKKKEKDGSYSWTNPVFNPKFVSFNITKRTTNSAMRLNKRKIYSNMLELDRCRVSCRKSSNNETKIKMILDSFVMAACGKITVEEAVMIR